MEEEDISYLGAGWFTRGVLGFLFLFFFLHGVICFFFPLVSYISSGFRVPPDLRLALVVYYNAVIVTCGGPFLEFLFFLFFCFSLFFCIKSISSGLMHHRCMPFFVTIPKVS